VLLYKNIDPDKEPITFTEYAKYVLKEGNKKAKKEILKVFGKTLYIHNREVCSSPIK
jgi:hypothetical protein